MILWAYVYAPGDTDDPKDTPDKESKGDHAAAQSVVEAILEHNHITRLDIQPEPLENFSWLSSIGEGDDWTDWKDPGTVRLEIPDLRSFFTEYAKVQQRR